MPVPADSTYSLVIRVEPQIPVVRCVRYHNDVGFTTIAHPRFRRGGRFGKLNCIDFETFHIVGQPAYRGGVAEVRP
jgi:hypothetical protein